MAVAAIVALLLVALGYNLWKRRAVQPQSFLSHADPDSIRDAFERKVATTGWKIVDDGNPMIAQSPLIGGIRQQVALQLTLRGEVVRGEYLTVRYVRKMLTGTPTKAVTLAARRSAFFREIERINGSQGSAHQPKAALPAPDSPARRSSPNPSPRPAPSPSVAPSSSPPEPQHQFQRQPDGPSPFAPQPTAPAAVEPEAAESGVPPVDIASKSSARPLPTGAASAESVQPWYVATTQAEAQSASPLPPPRGPEFDGEDSDNRWWSP